MIRLESVGKTWRRGRRALDEVTLELPQGARTAVYGPAGAGKSTLLGLMNRLVEPTSGSITWDDRPLRQHRKSALRAAVGWWSPIDGLFPERSVLDNILTVPAKLGWAENVRRARGFELLELLDLPRPIAVRRVSELSPADGARVALARSLAAAPEVLLADDPLAGLPAEDAAAVARAARRLQPEWGDRWLLGTGSLDDAIILADHLVVLDEGRVLQQGPLAEVIELPASDRVADLIGPDRGVRTLALQPAGGLTPRRVATVRDPRVARAGVPTLVVDRHAQPIAWTRGRPAPDGEVLTEDLGASFVPATGTLRDALEAVLTSPTGLGVAIGEHGRYLGVVGAEEIWKLAADHRAQVAAARADRAYAEREEARRAEEEVRKAEEEARRAAEAQERAEQAVTGDGERDGEPAEPAVAGGAGPKESAADADDHADRPQVGEDADPAEEPTESEDRAADR